MSHHWREGDDDDIQMVMQHAREHGVPPTPSRLQRRFGWGYTRAARALDAIRTGRCILLDRSDSDALTLRTYPEDEVIATRVRKEGRYIWRSNNKETQKILDEWQEGSTGEALAGILSKALTLTGRER